MRVPQVRISLLCSATLLTGFSCVATKADTISGTGGSWQSGWTQAQLVDSTAPTPGTPYWNNSSGDGPKGNIGWCLTGGSAVCTMLNSPGKPLPYFATAGGGSVANMFFTSSGAPLSLTLSGIITNEKVADAYDVFGYYVVPMSGSPTLVPLFSTNPGGSTIGSTTSLNLSSGTNYGFFIENVKGGGTPFQSNYIFYMNSALDTDLSLGPDGLQHFAVFQTPNGYIIGDVDGVGCTNNIACVPPTDFDFQDMIVTIGPAVPEPATLGFMGVSLVVFGGLLRRKMRRAS